MPTENDLRDQLAATPITGTLDPDRIIARSRARRRPRQVASGLVGALALTGVLVVGVQSIPRPSGGESAVVMESGAADTGADSTGAGGSEEAMLDRTAATALAVCGAPTPSATGPVDGLVVEAVFPASAAVGTEITGVARVSNRGAVPVTLTISPVPVVALSDGSTVVWHTNGPTELSLAVLELAPGDSADLDARAVPVRCAPEHEGLASFPTDLPPLTAGDYEVAVALDVTIDDGAVALLVSDPVPLTLR